MRYSRAYSRANTTIQVKMTINITSHSPHTKPVMIGQAQGCSKHGYLVDVLNQLLSENFPSINLVICS